MSNRGEKVKIKNERGSIYLVKSPWSEINSCGHIIRSEYFEIELELAWHEILDIANNANEDNSEKFVESLIKEGAVFFQIPESDCHHYSEVAARLVNSVRNHAFLGNASQFLIRLSNGEASRAQVINWLRAMFSFTKSAKLHIGFMCKKATRRNENVEIWKEFYSEEIHHWNIYRKIFSESGLDINDEKRFKLQGQARNFIIHLIRSAATSDQHYAALLYAIEMGPDGEKIEDDSLFRSLYKYYGFSKSSSNALFNHTLSNTKTNHSDLWFTSISSKHHYSTDEMNSIIQNALHHINIMHAWNDELLGKI